MPSPAEISDAEAGSHSSAEAPLVPAATASWPLRRPALRALCAGAALCLALLGCLAARQVISHGGGAQGRAEKVLGLEGSADSDEQKPSGPCGAEGSACTDSKCCADSGQDGLQCWEKSKYYAVCLPNKTCEAGVHEGETEGQYDQYGNFKLDEWSCKKLGSRSKPGCDSFSNESKCPSDRCMWMKETSKCMAKCSVFDSKEACPDTHCAWDGKACELDPCSAQWEDCSRTQCCSQTRGAEGMQCFQKDSTYSTCMTYCNPAAEHANWTCKEIGNRTDISKRCSFSGQDCSDTHMCCNAGHQCVVKDENFAGCLQTREESTWAAKEIPIPDDWEGTILGGNLGEWQADPAGEGEDMAGVSMFCFMAIMPDSEEVKLMEVAKKFGSGIFGCDAHSVYDSWSSSSAGWDTGEATLVNTDVFVNVWEQVRDEGKYLMYDWTIKTDADCAFFPDRLLSHFYQLRPRKDAMLYIKNTDQDASMSNSQFLGAIEIFSRKAVQAYFSNGAGCKDTIGLATGEDGFMKGCMDAVGAGFMHDGEILKPDRAASYCQTEGKVAFHPLKCEKTIELCYNFAMGNDVADWGANTC